MWLEAFGDAKAGEVLFINHAGEGLILASGFLSHSNIFPGYMRESPVEPMLDGVNGILFSRSEGL